MTRVARWYYARECRPAASRGTSGGPTRGAEAYSPTAATSTVRTRTDYLVGTAGSASSLRSLPDHIIKNTVFLALFGGHDVIPLRILLDPLDRLPGVQDQDVVDPLPHPQDFPRRDVDVGGLAGQPGHQRLVDHDARVRQREPLALGARPQQDRRDRRGLADAVGLHSRPDELHRVVNGEAGRD